MLHVYPGYPDTQKNVFLENIFKYHLKAAVLGALILKSLFINFAHPSSYKISLRGGLTDFCKYSQKMIIQSVLIE